MECPYCKKEMQKGKIPAIREAVKWYQADQDILYAEGLPLSEKPYFTAQFAVAYHCPDCRMVIVPEPTAAEEESTMDKLSKKWDAWHERRQAEKARKKDPREV